MFRRPLGDFIMINHRYHPMIKAYKNLLPSSEEYHATLTAKGGMCIFNVLCLVRLQNPGESRASFRWFCPQLREFPLFHTPVGRISAGE